MTLLRIPYFKQNTIYTCGPAVVRMILRYFKKNVSEEKLMHVLRTNKKVGTRHRAIISFLQRAGFYLYVNDSATIEELGFLLLWKHPVIVHYREPSDNEGHYAIVVSMTKKTVTLHDPWNGKHFKIRLRSFQARWQTFESGMRSHHWLMAVSKNDFQIGKQYNPL